MTKKKQHGHMWGCKVVWEDSEEWQEEWMWDITPNPVAESLVRFHFAFTKTRRDIMPLVQRMRSHSWVKSATAVKVPIPELP